MHKAFLVCWLLYRTCSGQTLPEQQKMLQILNNLFAGRASVEQQIDWNGLQVQGAPDLPNYQGLTPTQQGAFRKAFLVTMARKHPRLEGLVARRQGTDYFLGRFRFRTAAGRFLLTGL
jgi:hypothetical protein